MDNFVYLMYMGFCCVLFCIGLSLLMMGDSQVNEMHESLWNIIKNNEMIGD